MGRFELFMGYLGNGCTVCNKAVMEHGDYKTIAHISNAGNVTWYVSAEMVPEDVMRKIRFTATEHRMKFDQWFDLEVKHCPGRLYGMILDALTWAEYQQHRKEHAGIHGLKENCEALRELYRRKM